MSPVVRAVVADVPDEILAGSPAIRETTLLPLHCRVSDQHVAGAVNTVFSRNIQSIRGRRGARACCCRDDLRFPETSEDMEAPRTQDALAPSTSPGSGALPRPLRPHRRPCMLPKRAFTTRDRLRVASRERATL